MPYAQLTDIQMYYEVHGEASGTLILIGGLTRDHTIWRHIIEHLAKDFKVLVFDNRGSGRTDKPDVDYSIAMLSNDLAELINVLGIGKPIIIGHSMGAFMAMHYAAKYPDKLAGLVLCSACVKQVPAGCEYLQKRIDLVQDNIHKGVCSSTASESDIRKAMPWLYSKSFLSDENSISSVIQHEVNNVYPQPGAAFVKQAIACLNHNEISQLGNICTPTLVISGEEDRIVTPQVSHELTDAITPAQLVILEDAAHMIQIEQPRIFINILTDFAKLTFSNGRNKRLI